MKRCPYCKCGQCSAQFSLGKPQTTPPPSIWQPLFRGRWSSAPGLGYKTFLSSSLLILVQTELNESFRQVLKRRQRVIWPNFEKIRHKLSNGKFSLDGFSIPGVITPSPPPPLHYADSNPHGITHPWPNLGFTMDAWADPTWRGTKPMAGPIPAGQPRIPHTKGHQCGIIVRVGHYGHILRPPFLTRLPPKRGV